MMYFNNPAFWCAVCASCLLVHLKIPLSRTFWFGLINLACLTVVFSIKAALFCLGGAITTWFILLAIQHFNKMGNKTNNLAKLFPYLCIAGIVAIFLIHKSSHDNSPFLDIGHKLFERYSRIQPLFQLLVSLTFSYIFLRMLDAIRAVMGGNKVLDPVSLLGYLVPFYMLAAGPINIYNEYLLCNKKEIRTPRFSHFLKAVDIITWGLFLKFVCAEGLRILLVGLDGKLVSENIYQTLIIFIYVFFDFAGYSYVAYGIGKLLDIPTPRNFQHPYLSRTVTEFWTRWHVSLGDFVKRTIFMPLQVAMVRQFGITHAYKTNLIALLMGSFVFVGIWHRLSLNFILWGLAVGTIVALEKVIRDWFYKKNVLKMRLIKKYRGLSYILGPCYVFSVIVGTLHLAISDLLGQ